MPATGKWRQQDVPHKGWNCVDVEDSGAPNHLCEMCEAVWIRYIHSMKHLEYPQVLRVGCICAGHMEEDYEGAKQREKDFRRKQRKQRRQGNVSGLIETSNGE